MANVQSQLDGPIQTKIAPQASDLENLGWALVWSLVFVDNLDVRMVKGRLCDYIGTED